MIEDLKGLQGQEHGKKTLFLDLLLILLQVF